MLKRHKKARRRREPDAVAHITAEGWREIERACDEGGNVRPARSPADYVELVLFLFCLAGGAWLLTGAPHG